MQTFQILAKRRIVTMLVLSAVDRWFVKHRDYAIVICYLSAKHAALQKKSKDWLCRHHDNVSEWGGGGACISVDFCFCELALLKSTKQLDLVVISPYHHFSDNQLFIA